MELKRELAELRSAALDVLKHGHWALDNLGPGKQAEVWERFREALHPAWRPQ